MVPCTTHSLVLAMPMAMTSLLHKNTYNSWFHEVFGRFNVDHVETRIVLHSIALVPST